MQSRCETSESNLELTGQVDHQQAMIPTEQTEDGPTNALQIYCRLRPTHTSDETEQDESSQDDSIERKSDTVLSFRRPNSFLEQQYLFEHIFDISACQQEVFTCTTVPMIKSLLGPQGGQDGLMFAYGATSSGKSFTIGGLPHHPGIIPRSIDYLFGMLAGRLNKDFLILPDSENFYIVNSRISDQVEDNNSVEQFDQSVHLNALERKKYYQSVMEWSRRVREIPETIDSNTTEQIATRRYSVFVSFVEIYNNYIYDLLEQPDSASSVHWQRAPHALRHDARHTVYVCGSNEVEAKDADQAMRLFLFGVQNRQTAATLLNQCSSRSHSVFTIKVVSYQENTAHRHLDMTHLRVNQLSIVDLAGVERTSRTKATGMKLTEASNINNSLLTLRNCFEAMRHNQQQTTKSKQPKPIPYRQHKLTFLLKSFFEQGRAQIRMIVCVRPSVDDADDNVQVLGFGKKAQELIIQQQPVLQSEQQDFSLVELSDRLSDSSSEIDLFEFTFTRFKSIITDCDLLKRETFNRTEFILEVGQYLQAYEADFGKILRAIRKVMQQLNASLKPFPERQAVRTSIILPPYHLSLLNTFSRKVLPLYRSTTKERESSCLFGVTSIAGTPIVTRPNSSTQVHQHKYPAKCIVVQELVRDLSIWEFESIDIGARFSGQMDAFARYVAKLFNERIVGPSTCSTVAPVDVFTRLYQQTPARYKIQPKKVPITVATSATKPMSTMKVSMLKRLFTPDECPSGKCGAPGSGPRPLAISHKIKTLATQLTSLDPEFVSKMNKSVKWSSVEQARAGVMSVAKTSTNSTGKNMQQVKRQLFQ